MRSYASRSASLPIYLYGSMIEERVGPVLPGIPASIHTGMRRGGSAALGACGQVVRRCKGDGSFGKECCSGTVGLVDRQSWVGRSSQLDWRIGTVGLVGPYSRVGGSVPASGIRALLVWRYLIL